MLSFSESFTFHVNICYCKEIIGQLCRYVDKDWVGILWEAISSNYEFIGQLCRYIDKDWMGILWEAISSNYEFIGQLCRYVDKDWVGILWEAISSNYELFTMCLLIIIHKCT